MVNRIFVFLMVFQICLYSSGCANSTMKVDSGLMSRDTPEKFGLQFFNLFKNADIEGLNDFIPTEKQLIDMLVWSGREAGKDEETINERIHRLHIDYPELLLELREEVRKGLEEASSREVDWSSAVFVGISGHLKDSREKGAPPIIDDFDILLSDANGRFFTIVFRNEMILRLEGNWYLLGGSISVNEPMIIPHG